MILSPRITNESLRVILTNAFSLSSFRRETRTSVISIMTISPREPSLGGDLARVGSGSAGVCLLEHPASLPPLKQPCSLGQTLTSRPTQVDRLVPGEALHDPLTGNSGRNDPENRRPAASQVGFLHSRAPQPCAQGLELRPTIAQHALERIAEAQREQ